MRKCHRFPAVLAAIAFLAGCGSSPTEQPSDDGVGNPPPPVQATTQAPVPASSEPAKAAAAITAKFASGDELDLAVYADAPVTLNTLPTVVSGLNTCINPQVVNASRALAVPFSVSTTLDSSVSLKVRLGLEAGPGSMLVGTYIDGVKCSPTEGTNFDLDRSGATNTFNGWFVFIDLISPNHPDGDMDQLGKLSKLTVMVTNADAGEGADTDVTGPAVCDDKTIQLAGTVQEEDGCGAPS